MSYEALAGCLLGTALGDALGLPHEGASRAAVRRDTADGVRHRFLPGGRGWGSDDTDHTRLVAQALLAHPDDPDAFERHLAWGLRWWFWGLPPGLGLGTLRACVWLSLGFPPSRSGVGSAGNGPAMRAALVGVRFPEDAERRRVFVHRLTRLTHTDPRSEAGAWLVAELAALAVTDRLVPEAVPVPPELADEVAEALTHVGDLEHFGDPAGVSGFVAHTVPAAVAVVLTHPDDFRAAVSAAVRMGGDTDTLAAIVGAIVGARVGLGGLPTDWLEGFADWPWTRQRLEALARAVAGEGPGVTAPPMTLPRNLVQLGLAVGHLFRRLGAGLVATKTSAG